jgi:hypothetical protein
MQGGVKEPKGGREGRDLPLVGTTARNAGLPPMDPELLQQFQVFAYFKRQQLLQQQQHQRGTMVTIGPVVQEPSSQEGGEGRVGGAATSRDRRSHEWRLVARENEGGPGRDGERRTTAGGGDDSDLPGEGRDDHRGRPYFSPRREVRDGGGPRGGRGSDDEGDNYHRWRPYHSPRSRGEVRREDRPRGGRSMDMYGDEDPYSPRRRHSGEGEDIVRTLARHLRSNRSFKQLPAFTGSRDLKEVIKYIDQTQSVYNSETALSGEVED